MGDVYWWNTYNFPGNSPRPAAMPHNIDMSIWNHPGEGISQLSSMSAYTGVNQPYMGYTLPNNGMNMPNSGTNWGSTQPMRIPTTQAPSTAGVPAFNFELAGNQHGAFQRDTSQHGIVPQGPQGTIQHRTIPHVTVQQGPFRQKTEQEGTILHGSAQQGTAQHNIVQQGTAQHDTVQNGNIQNGTVQYGQSQNGHNQHGQMQQDSVKFIKVEQGTEQHRSNSHVLNQPAPGAPRVSTEPAPSDSMQVPGNHDIAAITDDSLRTVDPRDVQFVPDDNIGLDPDVWLPFPPQHSQDVAQVSSLQIRQV